MGIDFGLHHHTNIKFFYKLFIIYGFHPTYLGLYAISAIIILDNLKLFNKKTTNILILFFSFLVFITISRIAIICLVLFFIYKSIFNKDVFYGKIVIALLIMSVSMYHFSKDYRLKINQISDFKGFSYYDNNNYGSVSLRVAKIKASIRVWKKNKWFGVGPGQIEDQLISFYRTKSIQCWPCAKRKYNSHNEYLQLLATFGNIGLAIFLVLISFFVFNGIVNKNTLLLWFVFLLLMFSLTESVLERQRGITFLIFMLIMAYQSNNYERSIYK
jgi:O-antigen ligase